MRTHLLLFAALLLAPLAGWAGEPTKALEEHLKPFAPFLGKTWRAESTDPKTGKKIVDVSHWERTLNGQAVRIVHSLNDGQYCGETVVMYDSKMQRLHFWYFTSGGFFTEGTGTFEGQTFVSQEKVSPTGDGPAKGISEVRSRSTILEGGKKLETRSEYRKGGKWVQGHAFTYVEAPDAQVIMR